MKLVLEDRRFLAVLSDNYIYFGLLQRQKLVKLLGAQVKIVTVRLSIPDFSG